MNDIRVFALAIIALGIASPVSAQRIPTLDVSGGYQWISQGEAWIDNPLPVGWYVDVAARAAPWLGIVWQLSDNHKQVVESPTDTRKTSLSTVMGGVRVTASSWRRLTPFTQVMAGAWRVDQHFDYYEDLRANLMGMALLVGGGVDVRMTNRLGLRVGADYMNIDLAVADRPNTNSVRIIGGVVARFGN